VKHSRKSKKQFNIKKGWEMIITIRELNAFGNVLQQTENKALADIIHNEVLRMVKHKITEVDLKIDSPKNKKLCELIKKAEGYLRYQKTTTKFIVH